MKYLPSKLSEKEQEWAKEIGITAGGYVLENGSDGVTIDGGTLFASTYTGTKTDIIIPKDVSGIGMNAFSGCSTLSSVIISNSVRGIDEMAFSGCTSLTSVTMSNNLGYIGIAAFSRCTSLTSVTIPSSVTTIRDGAFFGCTNLTITISESTAKTCFGDTATEDSLKTTLGVKAVVFK